MAGLGAPGILKIASRAIPATGAAVANQEEAEAFREMGEQPCYSRNASTP